MNILVIDTGTSSMRGLLFDAMGKIIAKHQVAYFMNTSEGVVAEQSPEVFIDCLTEICQKIAYWCKDNHQTIDALSLTSQRSSVVPVDKDGKPLANVMMWYDKRSADICSEFEELAGEMIYNTCGMRVKPTFSVPKMVWFKRHRPEIYEKAHKLIGIHDYIQHHLIGDYVIDTSLASRTGLLNIREKVWSEELLELFGIDRDKLCRIIPVGSEAGKVIQAFAEKTGIVKGTPVISAGGDQQCSALGQMLFDANAVGITSGTGSYVVKVVDEPIFDSRRQFNLNVSAIEDKWIAEASNMASGSVYNWAIETLLGESGTVEEFNELVLQSKPGAGGAMMLPDLAGNGAPYFDEYAKGLFYNLQFDTKGPEMARAVLEGICAEVASSYKGLAEETGSAERITSAGGLSKFNEFNAVLSDMTSEAIYRCPVEETTGIGAWLSARKHFEPEKSYEALASLVTSENAEEIALRPRVENSLIYDRQKQARDYLRGRLDNRHLYDHLHGEG